VIRKIGNGAKVMKDKFTQIFETNEGQEVKSFARVAVALDGEERRVIMALLMTGSNYNVLTLPNIIQRTDIQNADMHLAVLQAVGLVCERKVNVRDGKNIVKVTAYQTTGLWDTFLKEWLKFRKDECRKRALREGHYP
jgi:hypothetical protein